MPSHPIAPRVSRTGVTLGTIAIKPVRIERNSALTTIAIIANASEKPAIWLLTM